MSFSEIIKALLSNQLISQTILYLVIGVAVWVGYFSLLKRFATNRVGSTLVINGDKCKSNELPFFVLPLIIVTVLSLLLYAINYVGYLPYGPDTSGYPGQMKELEISGHYNGTGYYSVYHTSLAMFSIASMISGSMQAGYVTSLSALLITLVLVSSIGLSRLYGVSHRLQGLIFALLFLSTPSIGGFDLLQQYVASVYAVASTVLLLSMTATKGNNYRQLLIFVIFSSVCTVTHLTPILFVMMLLIAYYTISRNNTIKAGIVIFLLIGIIYTLFATAAGGAILDSLLSVVISLSQGTIAGPNLAYSEIPSTNIGLLSWTLLPSIGLALISLYFFTYVKDLTKNKHLVSARHSSLRDRLDGFTNLSLLVFLLLIVLSLISKVTLLDISRYLYQPSYMALLLVTSAEISGFLSRAQVKRGLLLVTLLILLIPYLYGSLNDPNRLPQTGGLRLAPVTYVDRLEMVPLACYGVEGYYVYAWHDIDVTFVCGQSHLTGGGSYASILKILLNVADGRKVYVSQNSYFILPEEVVVAQQLTNYDIVLNGYEHMILTPKP